MNTENSYNRLKHTFWTAITVAALFCIWPQQAVSQANIPCYNDQKGPDYLSNLIDWIVQQKNDKGIKLYDHKQKEDELFSIHFDAFQLGQLKELLSENNIKRFNGVLDGVLKVVGSCDQPKFIGHLTVTDGTVELSNFGRKSFENVVIDTAGLTDLIDRYHSLRIDVQLNIKDDFYIRNTRFLPLKIKVNGPLELVKKSGQNVTLNGQLKAVSGFVSPFGKHFNLIEGTLHFAGSFYNPKIYFKSLYEPRRAKQEVKIWYIIKGFMEEPQFKFEGDPVMKPKNILSYTLFSEPFYQLDSVEQGLVRAVVTHTTAERTTEVLVNRMEKIATQKLSVDVVRIDNTTAESGTVVTTGWYLNPKVFFAIQNVIAGRPKVDVYLEYYLTQNLTLILSQDNDYGQGIDLEWEYDY